MAGSTVAWHVWRLLRDPATSGAQAIAAVLAFNGTAASFAIGWRRHLAGHVGQGTFMHLWFRLFAFWPILLAHTNDRLTAREWAAFAPALTTLYFAAAWLLWCWAAALYKVKVWS